MVGECPPDPHLSAWFLRRSPGMVDQLPAGVDRSRIFLRAPWVRRLMPFGERVQKDFSLILGRTELFPHQQKPEI